MRHEITFANKTTYLGRNGRFAAYGVEVLALGDETTLTPINSRGVARCEIEIPHDALPELIGALNEVHEGNMQTRANAIRSDLVENELCVRFEYDLSFWGGDYGQTGDYAYVPLRFADAVGDYGTAFESWTGYDRAHIVAWDDTGMLYSPTGEPHCKYPIGSYIKIVGESEYQDAAWVPVGAVGRVKDFDSYGGYTIELPFGRRAEGFDETALAPDDGTGFVLCPIHEIMSPTTGDDSQGCPLCDGDVSANLALSAHYALKRIPISAG